MLCAAIAAGLALSSTGLVSNVPHSSVRAVASVAAPRPSFLSAVPSRRSRAGAPRVHMASCAKLTEAAALLDSVDVFIFDCDGVIWKGDSLIEGVPAVLDMLRKAGKKIFFVTNNSTKSRKGYVGKFTSLGLNVTPEEIFSSSFAAAAYMEQIKFKATGKKVYVLGEVGIQEELDLIGVPHIGGPSDADQKIELKNGGMVHHDHDVGAVIVGFDRYINYYKIQYAQLCINENPGCLFIATNLDAVTHLTDAQEWAGNGAMVGAIKGCTKREPILVGKPSPLMIDYIVDKYKIASRARICMVGDRLDTDILFGRDNGLKTCLTLSGVTTEAKLLGKDNEIAPDYYVGSIAEFM
jgi:4-nitrophenyl phosphatase/phosphoglycolate phosphatase